MDKNTSLAKITRPSLHGILSRKRLFTALDSGGKKPVTWVSGPAGSGKTTLAADYLDVHKLPCLWYQVDEGDADIATFFYYVGLAAKKAAPRFRKPLPLLTPEYLQGVSAFTQRFFENLYARLKPPFAVVLDNYQEVSTEAVIHEVVNTAVSILPEGVRFFVLSRSDPPPTFARLRANSAMLVVGWYEWEEAAGIFREGLEADEHAEEFYQHLMLCYQQLGRRAEAIAVYNRCRAILSSSIGMPPSRKTEELYQSIIA